MSLENIIFLVILLACPLMHFFMMRDHGSGHSEHHGEKQRP